MQRFLVATITNTIIISSIFIYCKKKGCVNLKKYHEIVKDYIKSSKMSLSEITEKLNNLGIQSDKFYLSKLQNGKVTPAEESFNRAFAIVTNNDPDPLVFSSYIERTPDDVKQMIMQIDQFSNLLENLINNLNSTLNLKDLLDKDVQQQLLDKGVTLDKAEFSKQVKVNLTLTEKWNLFWIISSNMKVSPFSGGNSTEIIVDFPTITTQTNGENTLHELFKDELNLGSSDYWNIPILKHVYSDGVFKDTDYMGVESINPLDLDNNFGLILNVYDYGMSADGIQKGDQVLAVLQDDINPTDICIVTVKDKPAIIRRIQLFDDVCILRPSNPVMKLMMHPLEDVKVIGKVIEVRQRRKI